MFVVMLKFAENKAQAGLHMEGHKTWLQRGFDEGVFILSGSLDVGGGAILAHNTSLEALRARIDGDPFVTHGVVSATVAGITASRADERLAFLLQ